MAKKYDDGNRLRAARELMGLRSCAALVHHLAVDEDGTPVKRFSYGKLSKIESGEDRLAPQDAVYVADRLGVPRSFFTASTVRIGDIAAGLDAEARPVTLRVLEKAPRKARATDAKAVSRPELGDAPEGDREHDYFDRVLDERAAGAPPREPETGPASSPRTGTRRR